ncbi:PREDICTED: transferrin receptor protein 1-like [Crocodylus porosus]|uniref:transferrin receptor protein 1-like n=1 Tax=Crocodylus porosus TaxID=8502 RepID=UPI00093B6878|nr:PREDICTED: transferrin receptor protein 1-like [Crocodylus porosus]
MCSLGTSRFQSSCRSTSRAKMDQARAAISNLFRGEALSYTRFSMARQTDRDNSQVEMKLSAEEEEGGENSVPENMQTPVAKPRRTYNSWYCIAMMVVVLFLSGKTEGKEGGGEVSQSGPGLWPVSSRPCASPSDAHLSRDWLACSDLSAHSWIVNRISPQVARAERVNAAGVLIFPGYLNEGSMQDLGLFGHAHLGTGDPYTPGFPSFNHTQWMIPIALVVPGPRTRLLFLLFAGGYKPRRSIVFASWSAGDFGAVGATEWLEGYSSILHAKAFTYINLDAAVLGNGPGFWFFVHKRLQRRVQSVKTTLTCRALPEVFATEELLSVFLQVYKNNPEKEYRNLEQRELSSSLARVQALQERRADVSYRNSNSSGRSAGRTHVNPPCCTEYPASVLQKEQGYPFMGTSRDTFESLRGAVPNLNVLMRQAAELAGQIAVRLTYEHELLLDFGRYKQELQTFLNKIVDYSKDVRRMGLTLQWMFSARGAFERAVDALKRDLRNSDLRNKLLCRASNDRIMKVSDPQPFISPRDKPLRHIFFGSGPYTLQALLDHLSLLKTNKSAFDLDLFRNQLAMATWTIKEAGNALSGDVWDTDNEL